ncbi:hypothetical protein NHX12_018399 [Muraenolepis orangiensis]|uniref:Uncharacterized protein n=1 Tax=Muraenolepis orangiensis TaxID=630683 RepID=A0A9Q0IXI2_9TELE|nr:hypothetical protein NHX12_018399 [Muraenolepis orangiensis]
MLRSNLTSGLPDTFFSFTGAEPEPNLGVMQTWLLVVTTTSGTRGHIWDQRKKHLEPEEDTSGTRGHI